MGIANGNRTDTQQTEKSLGLTFTLIPGPNRKVQQEYGVYDETRRTLRPATVILDRDGFIRWKYVGRDDQDRPSLSMILAVLRELN